MLPGDQKDTTIITLFNTALKQTTDSLDSLRRTLDQDRVRIQIVEEKLRYMSGDQEEIKKELRERAKDLDDRIRTVEKNIIDDQRKRSNTIIVTQATILLLFAGSIITYLFVFLPRPH